MRLAVLKDMAARSLRRAGERPAAAEGKWDKHFRQWIAEAERSGQDPNDVGDRAWANDYLAKALESRYLALVPANGTVLELGPGSGRLTRHLLGRAGRIELIDSSAFVISWMQRYLEGKADFRAVLIDKPLTPHLADDSMDAFLAHGVFEHLDFDETYWFLTEFARVLKPGGRVSYNYDTIHGPGGERWLLDHRRSPGSRFIFRFYTPDFMTRIAEVAGLSVVESHVCDDRLAHLILTKAA
jgi:SAM-dependent methyltransferase